MYSSKQERLEDGPIGPLCVVVRTIVVQTVTYFLEVTAPLINNVQL